MKLIVFDMKLDLILNKNKCERRIFRLFGKLNLNQMIKDRIQYKSFCEGIIIN